MNKLKGKTQKLVAISITTVLIGFSPIVANASIAAAIIKSTSAVISAMQAGVSQLFLAMQQTSTQIHGDLEKQNQVNKTLAEATIDAQNEQKLKENADMVRQDAQVASDACQVMAVGSALGTANEITAEKAQEIVRESAKRTLHTTNQAAVVAKAMKTHLNYFCSDEDAKRTGCSPAKPELQNADIQASNLFRPNGNLAYTPEQSLAARSYVTNLVNPNPTQGIPVAMSKTPQGQAFIAAQMDEQRKLSAAEYSLSKIYANRELQAGLGARAMMPNRDASVMGVIEFYASKFLDPNKQIEIANGSNAMLLKEIVNNLSFRTWMDYKGYEQMERIEALLASSLAIQAKENSNKVLNASRELVR